MGKILNPSSFIHTLADPMKKWVQSLHKELTGSVDMGAPSPGSKAGSGINTGVAGQYQKGNGSGILIRVAAHGSSGTGATYVWAAVNVGIVINHGLLRQPIGFKVVDKDKSVDVYRTAAPDMNQITVAPTDNTASVTLYIF